MAIVRTDYQYLLISFIEFSLLHANASQGTQPMKYMRSCGPLTQSLPPSTAGVSTRTHHHHTFPLERRPVPHDDGTRLSSGSCEPVSMKGKRMSRGNMMVNEVQSSVWSMGCKAPSDCILHIY